MREIFEVRPRARYLPEDYHRSVNPVPRAQLSIPVALAKKRTIADIYDLALYPVVAEDSNRSILKAFLLRHSSSFGRLQYSSKERAMEFFLKEVLLKCGERIKHPKTSWRFVPAKLASFFNIYIQVYTRNKDKPVEFGDPKESCLKWILFRDVNGDIFTTADR